MKKTVQRIGNILFLVLCILIGCWAGNTVFAKETIQKERINKDTIQEETIQSDQYIYLDQNIHPEVISFEASEDAYLVIAPVETNPMCDYVKKLVRYPVENLDYTYGAGRDYEILLRIVEAEAGGEDLQGKILVANVIMNRIKSDEFPDTVEEVVYQTVGGSPQFTPTVDGRIDAVAISESTKEAVDLALAGEDLSDGAMYFMARSQSEESNVCWFDTHLTNLFTWGGHTFYR